MGIQWVAALCSRRPRLSWSGSVSRTHLHLGAILVGGTITVSALLVAAARQPSTRTPSRQPDADGRCSFLDGRTHRNAFPCSARWPSSPSIATGRCSSRPPSSLRSITLRACSGRSRYLAWWFPVNGAGWSTRLGRVRKHLSPLSIPCSITEMKETARHGHAGARRSGAG